jgi:hypothetical protein
LLLNANSAIFQLYYGNNKLIFNEIRFLLDQYAELDFHIASSLKQQSVGRHIAPLGHIILIPNRQPVFALSPLCCMLSREATLEAARYHFTTDYDNKSKLQIQTRTQNIPYT